MAKNNVARVSPKAKANKKAAAAKPKPKLGKLRLRPRPASAPGVPGADYAIWDIGFYHFDNNFLYYYPVQDDQIDSTIDLFVMGEASPSDFQNTDILAKVDKLDGTHVVAEVTAPHFGDSYPSSWIATIPAGSLAAGTSYVVKVRQYQDKAAASSEFRTI